MTSTFYVFDRTPTSYSQFSFAVHKRARELAQWEGKHVALWIDHGPDFVINLFAVWRIGAVPLLLSRRLPWTTVSTLLSAAGASVLVTSDIDACSSAPVLVLPSACRVHAEAAPADDIGAPDIGSAAQQVALILHTSGTTHIPKLVHITRAGLFAAMDFLDRHWDGRWTERDASLGWLPLFHIFGLCAELLQGYRKHSRYVFSGGDPADILRTLVEADGALTLFFAVPWMAQQIFDLPGGAEALRRLRYLVVGGAVLSEELGQRLTAAGVRTVQGYGMTEIGTGFMGSLECENWRELRPVLPERFWHLEEGSGQLIVHADCPTLPLGTRQDFATGDIFRTHPGGGYHYECRADDLLVHVSGEKSNALAIEAMLLSKLGEWIAHAAVIGAGRLRLAVILQWKREPSEADHAALSRGLAAINAELPAHSHLHEDLLLLLPAGDRRLPLTPKKTVARNKAEVEFRAELERLYAGTTVASAGASLLSFFDRPEALDRNVSLFKQGLNSLQAAGLRNHIAKLYPGRDIPLNLIFQQPTLAALEQFLIGNAAAQRTPPEFPPFTPDQLSRAQWEYPVPRHVLLTGASGFIGRHLLDALCARAHVERVYCPIRSGSRGLPVHPKVTVLPGYDLSDPHFGLGADTYQALLGKVDTIVHAAWPVNFNISYAEMADATLASVRHLVTFAERGDKALHFISSAATVSIQPESRKGARVEEQWPQPTARASLARGYAQTKWEAEHILIRSGVRFKIFRLGQVSAHSVTQQWNDLEYIPILLRATRAIGSTPLLPLPIDWVPVDIAVQALVELMTVAGKNIHHIANPHLRPAEVMARGTPCLPLQQWLTEVEPRLPEHGALMTLWSFLHDLVTWGAHMRVLGVQQTCADSPALAACEPISDSYLERLPY